MSLVRGILVVALGLCATARVATAQTESNPVDDIRQNSRMQIGPFYVTPQLVLKQIGIDNNVFNEIVDPKSDFTFNVAPTVNLGLPIAHRGLFRMTAASDLVYFARYASERSIDPQIHARAEAYLQRATLFVDQAALSSRQRPN